MIAGLTQAQTPDAFQYQALIAGDNGAALALTNVKVRINIRESSATGAVIYSEIHQTATNSAGMVFLKIGKGVSSSEILFSNINWAKGTYFLETEVDKGAGYVAAGTQQFLSVPYAKYADNAGAVIMTSSGGKKWKVTIDDAGNLSAQEITE
ncbi:MAG: hypothetical protein LBH19_00455 [Dysgonamonadaceae bacterium]|nr:hypothetical protein [Dysgonamonadaceae bacterium]